MTRLTLVFDVERDLWLPAIGCAAMMSGCAWMMWRIFRRGRRQEA
jgi:hypothetical protein